jgi:hypothetical protein
MHHHRHTTNTICRVPMAKHTTKPWHTADRSFAVSQSQCKHTTMLVVFHLSAHGEHVRTCPPCAHRHYRTTSVCRAFFSAWQKKRRRRREETVGADNTYNMGE